MIVRSITVFGTITQTMIGVITTKPMETVTIVSINVHKIRSVGPLNVGLIIVPGGEIISVQLKIIIFGIISFPNF
tara:strand:+ start:186 stop:410 length:225 start_codon:yes stop_codon:yes gene_type:complete